MKFDAAYFEKQKKEVEQRLEKLCKEKVSELAGKEPWELIAAGYAMGVESEKRVQEYWSRN